MSQIYDPEERKRNAHTLLALRRGEYEKAHQAWYDAVQEDPQDLQKILSLYDAKNKIEGEILHLEQMLRESK